MNRIKDLKDDNLKKVIGGSSFVDELTYAYNYAVWLPSKMGSIMIQIDTTVIRISDNKVFKCNSFVNNADGSTTWIFVSFDPNDNENFMFIANGTNDLLEGFR